MRVNLFVAANAEIVWDPDKGNLAISGLQIGEEFLNFVHGGDRKGDEIDNLSNSVEDPKSIEQDDSMGDARIRDMFQSFLDSKGFCGKNRD